MKQYRNEWKYRLNNPELEILKQRLESLMERDSYSREDGQYTVHSLYFDDLYDSCARENDAGTAIRYKYRIRYYNDNSGFLKLERKEKFNGRCHKGTALITLEQYRKLIQGDAGDVFFSTEDPVLRTFCIDMMTRGFSPKVIVDYDRIAYVERNTNVRITFDRMIRCGYETGLFLEGGYRTYPIQRQGEHVLEVKFDEILPGYIKNAVTNSQMVQTAFSKYYLSRIKLQNVGGIA